MKLLLTGHKGYVGKHLHTALKTRYDVATFSEGEDWVKWMQGLMRQFSPPHPEVIIHCGANPDSTYTDPDIFQWNYDATRRIADYAANCNARLIFFSSSCAIRPSDLYGWSKRTAEDYIRARLNGKYTNLRIFNIYGKENGRETSSVPRQIANKMLPELYVPCTRDYIHVDDVVRAVILSLNSEVYGTYEVGTGVPTQVRDLCNLMGWQPEKECAPPKGVSEYRVAAQANMLPGFECKHNILAELPKMESPYIGFSQEYN